MSVCVLNPNLIFSNRLKNIVISLTRESIELKLSPTNLCYRNSLILFSIHILTKIRIYFIFLFRANSLLVEKQLTSINCYLYLCLYYEMKCIPSYGTMYKYNNISIQTDVCWQKTKTDLINFYLKLITFMFVS